MTKILILASNPRQDLNLDREIRDLKKVVETSQQGKDFELAYELAVRVGDLQELMLKHQPQIVHFCGHGGREQGLVFESDVGREHRVRTEALSNFFRLFSRDVECVLLNACYSKEQADAIVTHIDYVIGMNQEIRDDAAIAFAKGFYRALGYACAIEQAYEFGCNAIQLEISGSSVVRSARSEAERTMEVIDVVTNTSIPEHLKPILRKKVTLTPDASSISQEKKAEIRLDIDKMLETDAKKKGNSEPEQNLPSVKVEKFTFQVISVDDRGKENSRTTKEAEFFRENLSNGVALEMVRIPSGQFLMGSPKNEGEKNEKPQHTVKVQSFWMGKYQVTQKQWRAVATLPQVNRSLNPDPFLFKGDNRPVEKVSWYEAVEFCNRLSQYTGRQYRLPSEAEWEYACRAGTTTKFYFGEILTPQLAKCKANLGMALITLGSGETATVGSYLPNAFGLYDMHGNLWEWCADHWHDSYINAPKDGSAWVTGGNSEYRILRGGSWSYDPADCRSANRDISTPAYRDDTVGFRVVWAVLPGLF